MYFIPLTVNLTKNSKLDKFVHELNALWRLSVSSMGALRELVAVAGIIPVSHKLNESIVEWTNNKTLLTSAFPDKFLFGQCVPIRLPTQQNWKHFSLYYDG
jgi:hypothetical protein